MRYLELLLVCIVFVSGCAKKTAGSAASSATATSSAAKPFDQRHLQNLLSKTHYDLAELETMFGPATKMPVPSEYGKLIDTYYIWVDSNQHKVEAGYVGAKLELLASTPANLRPNGVK